MLPGQHACQPSPGQHKIKYTLTATYLQIVDSSPPGPSSSARQPGAYARPVTGVQLEAVAASAENEAVAVACQEAVEWLLLQCWAQEEEEGDPGPGPHSSLTETANLLGRTAVPLMVSHRLGDREIEESLSKLVGGPRPPELYHLIPGRGLGEVGGLLAGWLAGSWEAVASGGVHLGAD